MVCLAAWWSKLVKAAKALLTSKCGGGSSSAKRSVVLEKLIQSSFLKSHLFLGMLLTLILIALLTMMGQWPDLGKRPRMVRQQCVDGLLETNVKSGYGQLLWGCEKNIGESFESNTRWKLLSSAQSESRETSSLVFGYPHLVFLLLRSPQRNAADEIEGIDWKKMDAGGGL